VTKRNLTIS